MDTLRNTQSKVIRKKKFNKSLLIKADIFVTHKFAIFLCLEDANNLYYDIIVMDKFEMSNNNLLFFSIDMTCTSRNYWLRRATHTCRTT